MIRIVTLLLLLTALLTGCAREQDIPTGAHTLPSTPAIISTPSPTTIPATTPPIDLEEGDRVLLATQMDTSDQIAVITDAGYGKRLPYMAFSAQNRGGKGMKAVGFYKNGANGRKIVHAVCIKTPTKLEVHMASDEIYRLNPDDFPAEKLDGRGAPTDIMVVLGNEIILCFECLE